MCVIIHKPKDIIIKDKDIAGAFESNGDGFGYMFYDSVLDKIIGRKACMKNIDKIIKIFRAMDEIEAVYHFRIMTHGKICDAQCHPFEICNKKDHGMDIYFMHNGVIRDQKGEAGESDTQMFRNSFLVPLLQKQPEFIETEAFKKLMESYIGCGNKLCFMYGQGKILRLNDSSWQIHDGLNVSNKAFVPYTPYDGHSYLNSRWDYNLGRWVDLPEKSTLLDRLKSKRVIDNEKSSVSFFGTQVHIGSTMFITKNNDEEWYAEGKVNSHTNWSVHVTFLSETGKEKTVGFFTNSGESVASEPGYQCIPMGRNASGVERTIAGDILEAKAEAEATVLDKGGEPPKLPPLLTFEEVKKKTSVAASSKVSHDGIDVDPDQRWFDCLDNSLQEYNDGSTILDFSNKEPQARFEWFIEHLETAYNMFQDLVEKMIEEDVDAGVLNDNDDKTVTKSMEDEAEDARIDEMMARQMYF